MPDRINQRDGVDQAWYADHPGWHHKGLVTMGARTARDVVKAIPVFGQRVTTVPVYTQQGRRLVEQPDFRATVRDKTTKALGIVSDRYMVIQDVDSLLTLEAVAKAAKAAFVSAAELDNGWLFASLDLSRLVDVSIKGDPSRQESFLIGEWGHDGGKGLNAWLASRRCECDNMRRAQRAAAEARGMLVSIRHAGDVTARIEDAQRVLGFVEDTLKADVAVMNALNAIPLPSPHLKWLGGFLAELVPIPQEMERTKGREEARHLIASLFLHGKHLTGVPDTPYRVLQAVTEYADHHRPVRIAKDASPDQAGQRLFRNITSGPAADMKARAMELLRQEFMVPVPIPVPVPAAV